MFVVIGAPVQHCMLRIDSLDSKGDSVLDLIHPSTSPLVDCRRELREIVSSGCEAGAPLAPVFAHFEDCPEVNFMEMLMEAKAMGEEFSSTNYYKTLFLDADPYTLFFQVHPKLPRQEKIDHLDRTCSLHGCCLRPESGEKVINNFRSADALRADSDFLMALRMVARHLRFSNMWSERLLAGIRKDMGRKTDAEGTQ